jgi:hypothetical protein
VRRYFGGFAAADAAEEEPTRQREVRFEGTLEVTLVSVLERPTLRYVFALPTEGISDGTLDVVTRKLGSELHTQLVTKHYVARSARTYWHVSGGQRFLEVAIEMTAGVRFAVVERAFDQIIHHLADSQYTVEEPKRAVMIARALERSDLFEAVFESAEERTFLPYSEGLAQLKAVRDGDVRAVFERYLDAKPHLLARCYPAADALHLGTIYERRGALFGTKE